MKTIIINEPFVKDFCRTQRWAARTRGRALRAPDWLAYATAVLEEAGDEVELYDFPAEGWDKDNLRDLVQRKQPEVVVLDATTPSIYSDIDCARIVKEEADSTVIMVGPHVSAVPEGTLKDAEGYVDVLCRGEYDYTVRDVVHCFKRGDTLERIPGISYRERTGEIKHNPDRPLIENLDELPFPAWHHLDIMKYFDGSKLYPYVDIIAGRGCPFRCIFCLWPQVMHGRNYRLRSARSVVDEMEHDIQQYAKLRKGLLRGELFFEDDTFTVHKKRAHHICDEILERDLDVIWSVNSRTDVVDLELFKKMKKAGCRMLLVGFESGDQRMLDNMRKGLNVERSRTFAAVAKKAGLQIHGCFVLGLPGETRESMERSIKFAADVAMDTVQFSAAVPFPGTEYYDYCKKNRLLTANDWRDWLDGGEQSTVVDYPGLGKREIVEYVDRGLKHVYFRPQYMVKFLLDTHSLSDLYRKVRGAKNFMSYLLSKGE